MCGIAGYISLRNELVSPVYLKMMAKTQRHRGPDHEGEYCDGFVALGSQRLAIVDLAGGDQPIFNEDGSIVIVYNGELYNYRELRSSLQRAGHRFKTETDTEVLVHAYEEVGLDFVSRLNGMFAFALWDRPRRRLMLGRDHLGMKPLYLTEKDHTLWFASEAKALVSLPHMKADVDARALEEYLLYQNILSDRCFFRGVVKLKAGHCLVVERERVIDRQYWDVSFDTAHNGSIEEHLEKYRALLTAAVDRHLIGDVEVGAHLSGGFDSTAVTLLAARQRGRRLRTFTGAFGGGGVYDERPVAREVARRAGAVLHEIFIDARMFWDALEPVCYAMDEPSVGSGAIPQYLVAQEAARHLKVVLTGHGGDELLLGYEAYKAVYIREMLRRGPSALFGFVGSLNRFELPRLAYFFLSRNPIVRHGLPCLFAPAAVQSLLAPRMRAQIEDHDPFETLQKVLEPVRERRPIDKAVYLYLKTYLTTLLVQEDKVGMAHSLESRMPLCDRELVEFMTSVPVEHKLSGGRLKFFPRTALRDLYPADILRQPKRGFPTPIARWFRGELHKQLEQRLFGPRSHAGEIFDVRALRGLWRRFRLIGGNGLMGYYLANQLYSLLTVVVWYELFISADVSRPGDLGGKR